MSDEELIREGDRVVGVSVVDDHLIFRCYDGRTIDAGEVTGVVDREGEDHVDLSEGDKVLGYRVLDGRLIFFRYDGSTLSVDTDLDDVGSARPTLADQIVAVRVDEDGNLNMVRGGGSHVLVDMPDEFGVTTFWTQYALSDIAGPRGATTIMTGDTTFETSGFNAIRALVDDPRSYADGPEDWDVLGPIPAPYEYDSETSFVAGDYTLLPNDNAQAYYLYVAGEGELGTPGEEGSNWTLVGIPPNLVSWSLTGTAQWTQGVEHSVEVEAIFGTPEAEALGVTYSAGTGMPTGLTLTDNEDNTATLHGTTNDDPGDYPFLIVMTSGDFVMKLNYPSEGGALAVEAP